MMCVTGPWIHRGGTDEEIVSSKVERYGSTVPPIFSTEHDRKNVSWLDVRMREEFLTGQVMEEIGSIDSIAYSINRIENTLNILE